MRFDRMHTEGPLRVVIAGGGVAALELMLGLRALAGDRVTQTLLAPARDFTYRPLSVVEPFAHERPPHFDLGTICAECSAEHHADALARVWRKDKVAATRLGERIPYDILAVATGARLRVALPGAVTFWGAADRPVYEALLAELETGDVRDLAFVYGGESGWALPLYELALMTASHARKVGAHDARINLVTAEPAPLDVFGLRASERVTALLDERGIQVLTGTRVSGLDGGLLTLVPAGELAADRVVALPRAEGPAIEGLPQDARGFLPVDLYGRVRGVEDVYAAGDATTFPVKQGGMAAQQADVVSMVIAARAGAQVRPRAFRPTLRGLLLTGQTREFLRAEVSGGHGETSIASSDPLWWPPAKVAGHYLAPYLAWLSERPEQRVSLTAA
jgi:sulfide:quinone oxidoreductase